MTVLIHFFFFILKLGLNQWINNLVNEVPPGSKSEKNLRSRHGNVLRNSESQKCVTNTHCWHHAPLTNLWKHTHTRKVIKDVIIWDDARSNELLPSCYQPFRTRFIYSLMKPHSAPSTDDTYSITAEIFGQYYCIVTFP